jgi:hypothetical protein
VGHEECGDGHAALVRDVALADAVRDDADAIGRKAFVHVPAYPNVEGERLLQVPHHVQEQHGKVKPARKGHCAFSIRTPSSVSPRSNRSGT